jgi:hypothetical protein
MAGLSHPAEPGHQIPNRIGRRWRKPAIDLPATVGHEISPGNSRREFYSFDPPA